MARAGRRKSLRATLVHATYGREGGRPVDELGENQVDRDEVLDKLRTHKEILAERFDVAGLALFGSFARDQATAGSDVDILVRFEGPATSRSYFGVQFYIEDLLGRRVDLVTERALRSEFRPYVEREALECVTAAKRQAIGVYTYTT